LFDFNHGLHGFALILMVKLSVVIRAFRGDFFIDLIFISKFNPMKSKFLRLDRRDFIKSLTVTIICTFITGTYQLIAEGGVINWVTLKPVVIAAIGAGVSYLTKNLLTNSQGEMFTTEPAPKESGQA